MNDADTITRIRKEIAETTSERKVYLDKATACDVKLVELNVALRVVERFNGVKETPARTLLENSPSPTISQQIVDCLALFGPLATGELVEKVNSMRSNPSTPGTIRVAASQLKSKGKIGNDGKKWFVKTNEALTESVSAPKVTSEVTASLNDSPENWD